MQQNDALTCPHCLVGLMKPGTATFTNVLFGLFISVPEMDAVICDVCGAREFSNDALSGLEALTGSMNPAEEPSRQTARLTPAEQDLINRLRSSRLKP
ncbi:MAG: hypothetical protein UZ15_CFX003001051 [Chloroflexi bacterium OLB15]|nr:MAG: hypothetical protein UZ15_CFX003001051 [Chloroflexi bacterium OLB15]